MCQVCPGAGFSQAHEMLARIHHTYDWDWTQAERGFRRALELNPSNTGAHMGYANFMLSFLRHEDAIEQAREAARLEPLSPVSRTVLARDMLSSAGLYDEAIREITTVVDINPNLPTSWRVLGDVSYLAGRYEQAADAFLRHIELSGASARTVEQASCARELEGARGVLEVIAEKASETSRRKYVDPWLLVELYGLLGERDRVFQWLERTFEDRNRRIVELRSEPALACIRGDPRCDDLCRRIGIPQDGPVGTTGR